MCKVNQDFAVWRCCACGEGQPGSYNCRRCNSPRCNKEAPKA